MAQPTSEPNDTTSLREAIAVALRDTPVLVAYLFGSRARGTHCNESDTDIGCVLPRDVKPSWDLIARLIIKLEEAGVPNPDVHILPETSLAFQAEAVLHGECVYSADDMRCM